MLTKHDKDSFWSVVKDCLLELLDEPARDAVIAVNEYRAEVEAADSTYEMLYHEEPFEVACALKGIDRAKSEKLYFENIDKYRKIKAFRNW